MRQPILHPLPWLAAGALLLGGLTAGCSGTSDAVDAPAGEPRLFVDVALEAGLDHRHRKPVLDAQLDNIQSWMASVGAAVAAADFDGDGSVDLFFTSSRKGEPNRLYANHGDGTFTEVAEAAGLAVANDERGTSMDAVWGDVDNDGDPDLYLVRWGYDALYRNDGDGTFTDVTAELFRRRDGSPGTDWANGNAAVLFDHDGDGRLDIYVGNYFRDVDLWHLETTRIMHDDFERARNAGPNFLYRQEADGTFTEVAAELGVDDTGWTLAVGTGDLDADGRPDLYCANDFGPDQLFLGRPGGRFENVSESALGGDTKKGMNVDFGDFNNDGWLDVYVTNITTAEYLQEGNMLWYNQGVDAAGQLTLTDISLEAGTWDGGWGWGAKFFDFDHDGDLDIVAANGFISAGEESYWYDLASWTVIGEHADDAAGWPAIGDRSFSGYEKERLWRNEGLFTFTEESAALGLETDRDGRGVAVVDVDNDGDLDVVIANQDQAPHLFRNDLRATPSTHWLLVALEIDPATATQRDGVGTRVTVLTEAALQTRERDGGNGFAGQSDPRLHFGLGAATSAELVEVRWPDGGRQYLEDVAANQILTIRQDPSLYASDVLIPLEAPGRRPEASSSPAPVPAIDPAELEHQLTEMEGRLGDAYDRRLASTYRHRAATYAEHDRAIAYLEGRIAAAVDAGRDPSIWRVELSLAFVDKIPACGGLAAIVCKGSLAKRGLDQLDAVLEHHPDSWLATYSRGMNHLHWPRALRHSAAAALDLERAVELQEASGTTQPHHLRTFVALGQAYAKDGRFDAARDAWRRGQERFPGAETLREHLAVADDDLLAHVEAQRSLEQAIDTDLSFFAGEL